MNAIKGFRLYVQLSASQTRRRLRGHGFGVRKVQSTGRGEAVIIHTATGQHLRELEALFQNVLMTRAGEEDSSPATNSGSSPTDPLD